jgi:hypothetical protein
MKMSADISAKAHAKVSGPPLVTYAVVYILIFSFRPEKRRCAWLSLDSPKPTSTPTLNTFARVAVRSVPLTSLWLHPGKSGLDLHIPRHRSHLLSLSRENALIIHYTRNDHLLRDGELVLLDAGGEYKYVVFTLPIPSHIQ